MTAANPVAEHDANLLLCRIERHLAALTDGDSPVGAVNPFFEDVGCSSDGTAEKEPAPNRRFWTVVLYRRLYL